MPRNQSQSNDARRVHYVKNSDLYEELLRWRDSNPDPAKRVPSERLGGMLLKIATHYMMHPNYVRYPMQIKEDIIGASCVKMLKSLTAYNFEYKNPFAYFTQICWSVAMCCLANYYKSMNIKRELLKNIISSQISEGVSIKSGQKYLNMLNNVSYLGDSNTHKDNEEFIANLLGESVIQHEEEPTGDEQ